METESDVDKIIQQAIIELSEKLKAAYEQGVKDTHELYELGFYSV